MNPEGKLTGSRLGIAPILLFDACSVLMWDMQKWRLMGIQKQGTETWS